MAQWRVETLGDEAFLLQWKGEAAPRPSELALAAERLRSLAGDWLREIVPAYDTLTLHVDALRLPAAFTDASGEWDGEAIAVTIANLLVKPEKKSGGQEASVRHGGDAPGDAETADDRDAPSGRTVVVPVRYGGEDGPDLAAAAARSGLGEEAFVRRHSEADYEVAMIGFAPGFPYLAGLPEALAQPRHDSPRLRVPAGSVGIAGRQTGIYPVDSPGGWQIVGRTPLRLFRPEQADPFPIRPGDRVRFAPVAAGEAEDADGESAGGRRGPQTDSAEEAPPGVAVLAPGLHATVQDLGRLGWQAFGVSRGGAMDREACRTANALVGNEADAAVLELTMQGGRYRMLRDALVALTGAAAPAEADGEPMPAGRPVLLRAGTELAVGRMERGSRAYLAFAGGIDVPLSLGSRSTDPRAGIGGLAGRPLAAGDALAFGAPSPAAARLAARLAAAAERSGRLWAPAPGGYAAAAGLPPDGPPVVLRVLRGRGWDWFDPAARARLLVTAYRVQPASDRMGIRLEGAPLRLSSPIEPVSHGVTPGTVQVPPDGQPILLASGCQPTGGYPILAHVISADLPLLGQLRPGQSVSFEPVGLAAAHAALARQEKERARREAGIRLAWYADRA
ncbi:5-oxoprolinase subunit PxpB [Cohnella sp. REN36]|uniref:5-oxoprolinase subunit PxpB n=1 Tax=Cohnella sp. REN36 TaxID=2887347 RepID=UPI001D158C2F|nr:5-oxoprolinase subunit PxpB [Cohnella sp. REN36]MCC3374902.1 5-oxoprolinase subunit PxpB [Cohnella sp. REN36]